MPSAPQGYRVIGGSALGDRLEYDRAFGQQTLRDAGLQTAPAYSFPTAPDSRRLAPGQPRPHRPKVPQQRQGPPSSAITPPAATSSSSSPAVRKAPVLLMPRLVGVEVGVGAYFDGQHFLRPACIDFEHKRFCVGEMGEMTGEMGTLVAYPEHNRIFEATLARLEPVFRDARHVGYVNLNMIANADGLWPLEFTCRFGNPGFAILAPLQTAGWGDLFARMLARRDGGGHETFPASPDWSLGIVLTVPPFPEERPGADPAEDPPLFYHGDPASSELPHLPPVRCPHGGRPDVRPPPHRLTPWSSPAPARPLPPHATLLPSAPATSAPPISAGAPTSAHASSMARAPNSRL